MQFSVLLSVYFRENPEYLAVALQSLIEQKLCPDQIVIVKDGKLGENLEIVISKFINQCNEKIAITIVEFTENKGLGIALAEGLKACKYDLVARMDTDDIACPERFFLQVQEFRRDVDLTVLGSDIREFETVPENITGCRIVPKTGAEIIRYAKKRNPFNHMTVMFRKAAILEVGNYQDFLWFEDYYLWVRLILKGYKMKNLAQPLVLVRAGQEMLARRAGLKYIKQECRLQARFLQLGFINYYEFLRNCLLRAIVRLLPRKIIGAVYSKVLRTQN